MQIENQIFKQIDRMSEYVFNSLYMGCKNP